VTSCDVTIRNRLGLHARAAAKVVHLATRFHAHVRVSRAADGADEKEALTALCQLVDSGFGEETWNV